LPSPSPSSASSSSSAAHRVEPDCDNVLFWERGQPISIEHVRGLQHELLTLKQAHALLLQRLLISQTDYSEAGFALDSIYSGHAFDHFRSDRPEGKRCSYLPIETTISTRCSKTDHAPGTCTHPPWSGTLTIDRVNLEDEMGYFNSIWHRAKTCLWSGLQGTISSITSRCSGPWDRTRGNPWGERPVVEFSGAGQGCS
jgi:hypothetical protein